MLVSMARLIMIIIYSLVRDSLGKSFGLVSFSRLKAPRLSVPSRSCFNLDYEKVSVFFLLSPQNV
jgi:hypothetical protein